MMRGVFLVIALLLAPAALAQPAAPTQSEIVAIQRKVQEAWRPPPDGLDVRGVQIDLRVALDPDGRVIDVYAVDRERVLRDPLYRRAAESAEAAVRNASPLPIPRAKAAFFKEFTMRFAPPGRGV